MIYKVTLYMTFVGYNEDLAMTDIFAITGEHDDQFHLKGRSNPEERIYILNINEGDESTICIAENEENSWHARVWWFEGRLVTNFFRAYDD